jgi:ribose transport system substrate-binding protein
MERRQGKSARRGAAKGAVLAVSFAMVISACSSAGTSSKKSSGSSGGSIAAAGTAYDVAAVNAEVAKYTTRPTSIGIDAKVKGVVPTGKTIMYLQCGAPSCKDAGDYLEAATKAVGWTLKRVNAGISAETVKAAWGQAVTEKPDGVVASGFPRVLFEDELAKLKALNIPVVDQIVGDVAGNGLSLVLADPTDQAATGTRLAQYILKQNNGKAFEALAVITSAYTSLSNTNKAFGAAITAACSTCKVDDLDVPVTSLGTDLPSRVTSYLSKHPKVKWVYMGFSDMVTGLPAALKAAGLGDVKVVTYDGNATTQAYLKNNQSLVAMDQYPAPEIMWRSVDFFIRTMLGEDTAVDSAHTLPVWVIDGAQVPSTTGSFPAVEAFESQYKALWNVT